MESDRMDSRRKKQIALEALRDKKTVAELAEIHSLPVEEIRQWKTKIHQYVEQLVSSSLTDKHKRETSDSLLDTILNVSRNGLMLVGRAGQIVLYNRRLEELWELPAQIKEGVKAEKAFEFIKGRVIRADVIAKIENELGEEPAGEIREYIELKDGRTFYWYSVPWTKNEELTGRVHSFSDVTDHLDAREKVQRFGALMQSINANVEEAILRSSPTDGLIYVNKAFLNMFGCASKTEAMQTDPVQFYAESEKRSELIDKLYREGHIKNEEVLFRRRDGSTFWGLETSTLVESNGQQYIDGIVNDISGRKKVEERLRQSEEKYRTIIENIEDGYFETDLKGNFTFFNESLRKILGYPAEVLKGMNNREYTDEETAAEIYKTFNRVYRTGIAEKGCNWEVYDSEGNKRFVETSVTLILDSEGVERGFRGIVRDVTDRIRNEKHIKQSLREKEVLLGEIHHRVKNNLAVISGLLFLQAEKSDDPQVRHLLKESESRIHSMALIHEMLYDNRTFSSVDPGEYIRQLIQYISRNLRCGNALVETRVETCNIELDMNRAIPCALIINELLTNAYKYAFEGRESGEINIHFCRTEDSYVLEVSDNGVGLPEDYLEPDNGEEKGLGLFLVRTLVDQIDGEMNIYRNGGTSVSISFS